MTRRKDAIAVVGMACVFPGAPDLATFWDNIVRGVDAITDVPPERWDPLFYDPASSAPDRFYCRRGGFVDAYARFDPLRHGVMPVAAQGAEPDQLLALEVAQRALEDAELDARPFARDRAAVIVGRGNYIGAGTVRLEQHVRTAQQLVECLRTLVPGVTEAQLRAVKAEFQSRLGVYGADTAIGLVPNLTASRIANRLDLAGPAYTVDAACASALVAIDQASRELRDGRVDLALAGGVHLSHDLAFWSVFCQLGALSRSERIRPFDRRADGLLMGEGVGVVVLERLADAVRNGRRVYAVLRGSGVASDGRTSLMSPDVGGQALALRRAWDDAGLDPRSVGLIEAHGTATAAGDAAELETLRRFFGEPEGEETGQGRRAGLGSVKSMIGHAMPAAGAAGFIKAALAVYHGVLPPTLNCEEPDARVEQTRFRVIQQAEPWEAAGPRRAGVNAFGFGGINAHVVLEGHADAAPLRAVTPAERVLLLAAATPDALLAALDAGRSGGEGPCRLAVIDPTPARLARAREAIRAGRPRRGRDGIWFVPQGLIAEGGRVAFLYPGVEAAFAPRLDGLPPALRREVHAATESRPLEQQGFGVVTLGRRLHALLGDLGVRPDLVAGHSVGEWTGMIATGMIPPDEVDALIGSLAPGSLDVPDVVFASAGCDAERARTVVAGHDHAEGLPGVVVSHDNCPHQVVLCGPEAAIDEAVARLVAGKVLAQKLPFRSGFHTPAFERFLEPHRARFEEMPLRAPDVPLWSATLAAPYPDDPDEIRRLALQHLVRPVRFRELVGALHDAGARVFVQVGTGSLVGFVTDTLRGKPHVAISANASQRSGVDQLRRVAAALFVEGAPVDVPRVEALGKAAAGMQLHLGVPLVRLSTPLPIASARAPAPADPVGRAFAAVLQEVDSAQADVARLLADRAPPALARAVTRRRLSVADCPWLLDHCFFVQPPDWPVVADRYPVVPMTMSIQMVIEAARAIAPDRVVVAVEDVRAARWLAVEPPVAVEIRAERNGDRVSVEVVGYLRATAVLAPTWPAAPAPATGPLPAEVPITLSGPQLYADRWMFHGPGYHGVTKLHGHDASGIRGTLTALPAEGALLDCAGQLFGYWIMLHTAEDHLAMPVKIDRLSLYGPDPAPGTAVECRVAIERLAKREVRADLELTVGGRVWARIQGWEDWRFDTDDRLWAVIRWPERNLLADSLPGGVCRVRSSERSARSWDYLARRFLGVTERAEMDALPLDRRRGWLGGRIAAKDAARRWLREQGGGDCFPVEIGVAVDEAGRPHLTGRFAADTLFVSIAHKDDLALACVREGRSVGVDLERVAPRTDTFVRTAFADSELALLGDRPRDEWLTRLWVAKEAAAKARGTGMGSPRRWPVEAIEGERLQVDGLWVETRLEDDYVYGWTE